MARQLCVNKFNTLINDIEISKNIENSIYNFTLDQSKIKGIEPNIEDKYFKRIYVNKIITLFNNLDKKSYIKNISFLDRLLNNEIDPSNIAYLSPQEINKEHWKKYLDRQSANDEFLYSRTAGIRTNEFKCG